MTQGVFDDCGRLSARSIERVMSIVWFKVGLLPSIVLVEALLASSVLDKAATKVAP